MTEGAVRQVIDGLNKQSAKNTLGGRIINAVSNSRGIVELEMHFDIPEEYCHRLGLQGGFVVGMLENSASQLVRISSEDQAGNPTLELKVSFLRPGNAGRYRSSAKKITKNSAIGVIRSQLFGPEDKLIATGTATVLDSSSGP